MKQFLLNILNVLLDIESEVDRIHQKMETLMATAQDFKTLVKELNTETDRLAAKLQDVMAKLASGGMTAEEEAAALADGQAVVDRLKALGQDQNNPIPPATT